MSRIGDVDAAKVEDTKLDHLTRAKGYVWTSASGTDVHDWGGKAHNPAAET